MSLEDVPDVDIDPSGVFKYILIRVTAKDSGDSKLIVRGYVRCTWHKNILKETMAKLGNSYTLKCVGGGRIRHEPDKKRIFVYGYSQRYGPARHETSVDLLKNHYPNYDITYSYEGY